MLRTVCRSLVAVIGAPSQDVFAMDAAAEGTPLDVFEYLLDELHWGTFTAFVVWLDEGYPWPESWQWYRKIHKTYGLCLPTIRELVWRRVCLWVTDRLRRP